MGREAKATKFVGQPQGQISQRLCYNITVMNREYDLFEKMPDGSHRWREFVQGLENARAMLAYWSELSPNEFYAIHTPTKEIVARVNTQNISDG